MIKIAKATRRNRRMDNWESWAFPLAVVSVLFGINRNLRGSLTPDISSLLWLAMLVLAVVGFCSSGWLAGSVGLVAAVCVSDVVRVLSPLGPLAPAKVRKTQRELASAMQRRTAPGQEHGPQSPAGHDAPYHDKERHFKVWLRSVGDPPSVAGEVDEGNRLRLVETHIDLVEKVRVFEAGFDDRLVELLKVWVLGETEDLEKPLTFVCLDSSRDYFEFAGSVGEVVLVAASRYHALREQFAAKFAPDRGWQRIDRGYALNALGLGSRVDSTPTPCTPSPPARSP